MPKTSADFHTVAIPKSSPDGELPWWFWLLISITIAGFLYECFLFGNEVLEDTKNRKENETV